MPYPIERAVPADFLHIAALDRISWEQTGEPFIADGEHCWRVWCEYATVLVARQTAQPPLDQSAAIAGAVVMFPTNTSELFLHKIMVHPALRGQGIGTALMLAALELADAPVLLTVDPANTAAIKLYQRQGYTVRQRITGYYRAHEDRLLMQYQPPGQ